MEQELTTGAQAMPAEPAEITGAQTEEAQTPQRKDEFEKLVRGPYKAEFDERVQRIIDRRFRETRQLKERAEKTRPVLEYLKQKYGEEDEARLEERLRAEAAPETESAPARDERAERTVARWREEARSAQSDYPGLDLGREMGDARFRGLLRAGVDVRTAYEVVHNREILAGAMRYTAQKVREKTVSDIRARGERPEENGAGGHGALGVGPLRVDQMTRAQREAIERRCARGEKVYFGQ